MSRSGDPFIIPQELKESPGRKINQARYFEVTDNFSIGEAPRMWLGGIIPKNRSILFLFSIIGIFLILIGRLAYLQLDKGDLYRQLSEGNRLRLELLPAPRGIIFDQFEKSLVENKATFSLIVYPNELKIEQKESLEKTLNLTDSSVLNKAYQQKNYFPLVLEEDLTYDQAVALMIKLKDFSGLKIEVEAVRNYLYNNAFAHLLGYTSRITPEEKDNYLNRGYLLTERVGRSGIEESYQELLRGKFGKKRIEVDSLGREQKVVAQEEPVAGANIILNIDGGLQEQIAKVLQEQLPKKSGAVVALDPQSGKVRALVSWPLFNHNAFTKSISVQEYEKVITDPLKPLFNRAISGTYPPGSTIKLVIGAAALQEGLIDRQSQILSFGGVWYDKWFFPDWKAGGHGYTNIIKALAESVNTFFYYLALPEFDGQRGLGLDKMLEYFKLFGLDQLSGIKLSGEAAGFLPSRQWKEETKNEAWYPGDTLHLAIGQGDLLVTPLQIADYTAVIANGGTLYQPQLVNKIINPVTGQVQQEQPVILRDNLVNKRYAEIIREGMRAAVTSGSAQGVNFGSTALAGKTGTAQVSDNKLPQAWFTSFGPYSDPKLVLTILVENGGEGSVVAVPIAREIWRWYAENRL